MDRGIRSEQRTAENEMPVEYLRKKRNVLCRTMFVPKFFKVFFRNSHLKLTAGQV